MAQKEVGRPDLDHLQASVFGIISQPGRRNHGHKRGRRIPFSKLDAINWSGARAPHLGIRSQHGHCLLEMTRSNASLTTKLSYAMRINLEMDKKLNIKAMHNPKDKKLLDKAKRKDVFEKNLDINGY